MDNYMKKFGDDVIVALIQSGSTEAEIALVKRYKGFSFKLARRVTNASSFKEFIDINEMQSIALHALFKAAKSYRVGEMMFHSYWMKTAKGDMMKFIQRNKRYLETMSRATNLPHCFASEDEHLPSLQEIVTEYIYDEKRKYTKKQIEMFNLFLEGYTAEEIGEKVKATKRSVYYNINRIKNELKEYLLSIKD